MERREEEKDPLLQGDSSSQSHANGQEKSWKPSCRIVLAVMSFLGFVNVYCLRVNLSVAIVYMVNSSYLEVQNATDNECPGEHDANQTDKEPTGEFNWSSNLQGLALGSFFYGYITTQVLGGWLAERMGGKLLYGLGILCTASLTLLTPVAARASIYLFLILRVLEGVGEGVTFPAMNAILAKWAPPLERSKMVTFIFAGSQFGTVLSSPISGLLCDHVGWPSVFYIFGSIGCVWFIFWMSLCFDSPAKNPYISKEERQYIEKAIGATTSQRLPTPWVKIFSSVPFWALLTAHFSNNWGFYTLLTCLPSYMLEVLKFDISQNGILSGLPYFVMWMVITLGGQVADTLRKRRILSTTKVRKLFNGLGLSLPAAFLLSAGFLGCNKVAAVVMVTLSVATSGIAMSGYGVNHLDIAPPFAGTLMGLTNMAATIPGFVGPQVVGALTHNNPSRWQWQKVFYISVAVYVFGTITYLIFGSGERQYWSTEEYFVKNGLIEPSSHSTDDDDSDGEERDDDGVAGTGDPVITFGRNVGSVQHSNGH